MCCGPPLGVPAVRDTESSRHRNRMLGCGGLGIPTVALGHRAVVPFRRSCAAAPAMSDERTVEALTAVLASALQREAG
jgi:hypothetical protein